MDCLQQYSFVKSSRAVLLQYCSGISAEHFISENTSFGRGSIRNLLVHIGNTYEFWIGGQALHIHASFRTYDSVRNVTEVADYFLSIDELINEFFSVYADNFLAEINTSIGGKLVPASPLKLFTHVITHEFHHKGQVLSLSRHFGYVPVDTDIIR
jgi:uncharacterized damage-inducible protein DinB